MPYMSDKLQNPYLGGFILQSQNVLAQSLIFSQTVPQIKNLRALYSLQLLIF